MAGKKMEVLHDKKNESIEYVERQVKSHGHRTARVLVPREWIGQWVRIYNLGNSHRT